MCTDALKELTKVLLTSSGKEIAKYFLIEKKLLNDPSFILNSLSFLVSENHFYLAGKMAEEACFFCRINAERENEKVRIGETQKARTVEKLTKLSNEFLEKSFSYYQRQYLYECAAKLSIREAEYMMSLAQQDREQAEINKSQSRFEKAKFSRITEKYYRNQAKKYTLRTNQWTEKALAYYSQAIKFYELAGLPALRFQTEKNYQSLYTALVSYKKGNVKAMKFAASQGWFSLASEFAKKNRLSKKVDHFDKKLKENMIKFGDKAKEIELDGRIQEDIAKKFIKKSKTALNKSASYQQKYDSNKFFLFGILKSYYAFKSEKIEKKASTHFQKAFSFYEKAKSFYIQADMFGKFSEMDGKINHVEKQYESQVIEAETVCMSGDIIQLNQKKQNLEIYIKSYKSSGKTRYFTVLTSKRKTLEKIIKHAQEGEKFEMKAEAEKKPKVMEKFYISAIQNYEQAGLFKLAYDIAQKIQKSGLAAQYKSILELKHRAEKQSSTATIRIPQSRHQN